MLIPITSAAETITVRAAEDVGMLDSDDANDPFPGIIYSELDTLAAGNVWLSLLKFDLEPLRGLRVTRATLELTSNFNHDSQAFEHRIFSSFDDSWTEETVTGITRPADGTLTAIDAIYVDGSSRTWSWDATAAVTGPHGLDGANTMLTLLLRPTLDQTSQGGFGPHFDDREDTNGPRLIIETDVIIHLDGFESGFAMGLHR